MSDTAASSLAELKAELKEDADREPLALIVKDREPIETVAFACGKCGVVAADEQKARNCYHCCTSRECEDCGKPTDARHWLVCEHCRTTKRLKKESVQEAEAFNAATKVALKDYAEEYVCLTLYPDEGSYRIPGEWEGGDEEDLSWVWGCKPLPWPIPDMSDVMFSLLEDEFPENASESLDVRALQKLVEDWFAQQKTNRSFHILDKSVVVVLDPERTPERLEAT